MSAAPSIATVLPGSAFGEHHHAIIAAPAERIWEALQRLTWSDVPVMDKILAARVFNLPAMRRPWYELFTSRAHMVVEQDPPHRFVGVMIGKPWSAIPQHCAQPTLEAIREFDEPGWLKYGMEWVLTPLPDGRTLVETTTLNEPTDTRAKRRFAAYWALIRVGSALLRVGMLAALGRAAQHASGGDARAAQ